MAIQGTAPGLSPETGAKVSVICALFLATPVFVEGTACSVRPTQTAAPSPAEVIRPVRPQYGRPSATDKLVLCSCFFGLYNMKQSRVVLHYISYMYVARLASK